MLQASTRSINIAGSRATFERAFSTRLVSVERETIKSGGKVGTTTCIDVPDTPLFGLVDTASSGFADLLEGVAIEQPYALQAPTAFPPPVRYWHLDVPADVSLGCNADRAHRSGVTGLGIRIAMVDTGQAAHPFFTERGYRVEPTVLGPGTVDPHIDSVGHGTGESANIFATAPDITLLPVKCANASGSLVNTTAAFAAAAALNPTVISCSWSRSIQNGPLDAAANALAAEIASAVNAGIIVCFSASNGGWGFPAQVPDVIAVGGVFMEPRRVDARLRLRQRLHVEHLCGPQGARRERARRHAAEGDLHHAAALRGSRDRGRQRWRHAPERRRDGEQRRLGRVLGHLGIVPAGCRRVRARQAGMSEIDARGGEGHPDEDGARRDGRIEFAAHGSCPAGSPAGVGPDNATGAGMVDAYRAVLLAKLRCTVVPLIPFTATGDTVPAAADSVHSADDTVPAAADSVHSSDDTVPAAALAGGALVPFLPPRLPIRPLLPFGPGPGPGPGPLSEGQSMAMTPDDVAALERMLLDFKGSLF